ncbi:hypothetical protein Ami103574_11655 [Aminipila butyrica]|uniref:Type ii secretion system (T2ss) protein f n=1 Tax=Aminipila butyrica TaxID=433296 RepID=A0A858C0M3_9FIRM|nr:hypothetical protein [Aminipila butyrica]QIB69936.1 hypothetical protein Ami103574_11655 [Aminipila butyrica]
MKTVINISIEVMIYLIFLTGSLLVYQEDFVHWAAKVRTRHRLRERRRQLREVSLLERHLDCIARTTLHVKGSYLLMVMVLVFISVGLVASRNLSLHSAVVLGAIMAVTPYLILRIRFEGIRRRSSFEGEMLVSNFLNQYRIVNFNVYEALEKLLQESKNTKVSNPFVLKMLLELRNAGNQQDIRLAVRKFADVINTNWCRMFAYNIRLAAERGLNVSVAIEDILVQLRDARAIFEERKRLNSEAIRIVVYMIPLLYVFTVIISVKYIGMSLKEYIVNQLFTKEGILFFMVSGVMFLMNIAVMEIVSRQKFDY